MIIVFRIFPPTCFDRCSDQEQLKQFHLAHNTDDTHHKHSGLKLTTLLLYHHSTNTNNLDSQNFNNYPFLAYMYAT